MSETKLQKNQNTCLQINDMPEAKKTVYINLTKTKTLIFYCFHMSKNLYTGEKHINGTFKLIFDSISSLFQSILDSDIIHLVPRILLLTILMQLFPSIHKMESLISF
jgi:hypothetical protein